ncbi:S1 RNA-binding domain-containing protein [Roseimaritima ulvae]|uniref:30S ribosomal protein S1 n=1 Tax=Roseimaritima ulvae TaxID=980254 RepID=A0A5B9QI00_9BACT|nr:S1 RNA-binding domain-containing protein [Roseimaritima ulvae]QEG38484.1 30S ribosomal protein S1 [Roseimaritima ulvae]
MTVGENPESQAPQSQASEPQASESPASQPQAETAPQAAESAEVSPASSATTPETPQPTGEPAASSEPAPAGETESAGDAAPAGETAPAGESTSSAAEGTQPAGPLSAAARRSGPLAARGGGAAKPASPTAAPAAVSTDSLPGGKQKPQPGKRPQGKPQRDRRSGRKDEPNPLRPPAPPKARVAIPSKRGPLSDDIQQMLDAELAASDLDSLMSGAAGMADRPSGLNEGQRVAATVLKIHDDSVFVALGGPDEGMVPFEQFAEEPTPGQNIEVVVQGLSDGLYVCVIPGQTIAVTDMDDLEEGAIVEATITGTNSGGLECAVGGAEGFMPISQIAEHRVEDTSEFVGQKMVCSVTECNPRRRRLVLSRRAVLEREREERREEQLEQLEAGDVLEGTVRSIKDFGAFVDLGGCDGMIHISKLSWDRVQHPSEVLEMGQKVKVTIETIDKQTGKISLSYRDLIANPWDTVEVDFPVGEVVTGTVSRIANFGAFVRLAAGIEGLIHISELAHHRVSRVNNVVNEGDEVNVKVQSIDRDAQRIGLSLKAALAPPPEAKSDAAAEEVDEPPREPVIKPQHSGPLKGGTGGDAGGERFGLRW